MLDDQSLSTFSLVLSSLWSCRSNHMLSTYVNLNPRQANVDFSFISSVFLFKPPSINVWTIVIINSCQPTYQLSPFGPYCKDQSHSKNMWSFTNNSLPLPYMDPKHNTSSSILFTIDLVQCQLVCSPILSLINGFISLFFITQIKAPTSIFSLMGASTFAAIHSFWPTPFLSFS